MKKFLFCWLAGLTVSIVARSQEQLPDFSAYKVGGGKVVIAWTHNYQIVKQINVQRSHDSTNFFKTLVSMPDPMLKQNGFADKNPPGDKMFYRIFVLMDQGKFIVTKAKRANIDSVGLAEAYSVGTVPVQANIDFLPQGFTPSQYIFTSADRYVRVELPLDNRKFDIKFFSETLQPLFELNHVKEKKFKLDRSYFYSAGYINFELFADGKLLEKNKVYLPKEF